MLWTSAAVMPDAACTALHRVINEVLINDELTLKWETVDRRAIWSEMSARSLIMKRFFSEIIPKLTSIITD